MKFIQKLIIALLIVSMASTSCNKQFDSFLNSPNSPLPSTADVDLYLNTIQLDFSGFFQTASDRGGELSRQQQWGGPLYRNAYTPATFDGLWSNAYTGIISNANAMIPIAQAQKKYIQSGIAKILKAYTIGTLVDDFGDVPYSEAELGLANPNPKVDGGAAIYAGVQALLDDAIVDLGKTGAAAVPSDLFYAGKAANWITLAKTLKLKFYMQVRLVDSTVPAKITALLTENNLINTPAQDFVFKYGTSLSPDSRHPHYGTDYVTTGGVGEYMSDYFMWVVGSQKYGGTVTVPTSTSTSGDPRMRYYFYRQSTDYSWANSQTCPCFGNSQYGTSTFPAWYSNYPVPTVTPYCVIGKGYLGRDHGDNSGAPPDGSYRTAFGIYPAGGQFDANQAAVTTLSMGGLGAGISPIWLSSYTSFLEAEAAMSLGITTLGSARTLLTNGVTASINKVIAFPATVGVTPSATYVPSATLISNYISLVQTSFDNALTAQAQLNVIETEYYIALWGNGIESYNNLRRTGMPLNIQPAVAVPNPGFFMRSFYYPAIYVTRNLNAAPQKTPGDAVNRVFWDTNTTITIP